MLLDHDADGLILRAAQLFGQIAHRLACKVVFGRDIHRLDGVEPQIAHDHLQALAFFHLHDRLTQRLGRVVFLHDLHVLAGFDQAHLQRVMHGQRMHDRHNVMEAVFTGLSDAQKQVHLCRGNDLAGLHVISLLFRMVMGLAFRLLPPAHAWPPSQPSRRRALR